MQARGQTQWGRVGARSVVARRVVARRVGARRVGPEGGAVKGGGAQKIALFFFPLPLHFRSFCLSF